jgi:hypothetical protein
VADLMGRNRRIEAGSTEARGLAAITVNAKAQGASDSGLQRASDNACQRE